MRARSLRPHVPRAVLRSLLGRNVGSRKGLRGPALGDVRLRGHHGPLPFRQWGVHIPVSESAIYALYAQLTASMCASGVYGKMMCVPPGANRARESEAKNGTCKCVELRPTCNSKAHLEKITSPTPALLLQKIPTVRVVHSDTF